MPKCASIGTFEENTGVPDGTVDDRGAAEYGELWVVVWLFPTTGNKGCETGTEGVDVGSPGGAIWACNAGELVDGIGGLTFCTGNNGWCAYGTGGGTEAAGAWGYHGWGRGGATPQALGGTCRAGLYLQQRDM